MFTSLAGRSVVITGGSRGIGKGIARVMARAGACLTIGALDAAGLAATAEEMAQMGAQVATAVVDVARTNDCARLAATAHERFGGIDVLCANAGIYPESAIAGLSSAELDAVLDCNVKGTIFAVQACLAALSASGRGRVIITSSITGPLTGFPGFAHYGASKAAQLGFMRTAALELAPRRITVNAVLPGNIRIEGTSAEEERQMVPAIPLGRLGSVEDIGYACLFLASEEAGYITGQTIVVDGGQVLPESRAAVLG